MLQVNTDMADSQNVRAENHKNVSAVDSKQEKSDDGKGSTGNWNAKNTTVKILHGLFAFEIADPVNLIKDHT